MLNEHDRIPCTVYEIDSSLFPDGYLPVDIIDAILKKAKQKKDLIFKEENVGSTKTNGHLIRIFACKRTRPPKWRPFLSKALHKDSEIHTCTNTIYSFICFIEFNKKLFAITGGSGNFSIEGYIVQNFGLEILIRIFKRDSKVIKYIQDRGVSGIVIGQTKFYRGDRRFSEEAEFGKILKEVKAEMGKKQLVELFGLDSKTIRRNLSGCLAKSSFRLSNSVNFESLLVLIEKFCNILAKPQNFALNTVTLVSKRYPKNEGLLKELDTYLIKFLYNSWMDNIEVDFDLCHTDFSAYLTASNWTIDVGDSDSVEFEDPVTWDSLLKRLREKKLIEHEDEIYFKHSVLERVIESIDSENEPLTSGTVFEHLHGEITYNDKSYFRIDREWYEIQSDFIKDLNAVCNEMIAEYWDETLINEQFHKGEKENDFNSRFIGVPNHIVCDKITPENIEVCDILRFDENSLYLIHIKKDFNNCIRDLAAQISISANRIREDKKTGYKFIEKLEEQIKKGKTSRDPYFKALSQQSFPTHGLKEFFKSKRDRNIVFCLAFVDTAIKGRSLKNKIEFFNSNIAKYAIIEIKNQLKSMGFDFKIIQLKRDW